MSRFSSKSATGIATLIEPPLDPKKGDAPREGLGYFPSQGAAQALTCLKRLAVGAIDVRKHDDDEDDDVPEEQLAVLRAVCNVGVRLRLSIL